MSHALITQLKAQRKTAWDKAKAILDTATAAGRDLTAAEDAQWRNLNDELDSIDARVTSICEREQQNADIEAAFAAIGTTKDGAAPAAAEGRGYLNLRTIGAQVRTAAERDAGFDVRALLAGGSTATVAEVLTDSPVDLGKPATALLDVIPTRVVEGAEYSYLRQTARTNNAAPVAVGGTKPESVMTLTRVAGTLNVVAHLSEPIHEYWLTDNNALQTFVQAELGAGIGAALEDELLNGTGVAPSLNGIIATATGTQAYATSPVVTIRTAIAQLEAAGLEPSAVVLASSDWLAIETATVTGGAYLLGDGATGAPLDRIKRTLWGVPVVVSTAHTAGTAVLLSKDSVGLVTDGGVLFKWGQINTDFQENQIRGRAELRAEVEVYRPAGIIVCDLTA